MNTNVVLGLFLIVVLNFLFTIFIVLYILYIGQRFTPAIYL